MTKYVDIAKKGPIRSVEVTLAPDEIKACVHLRSEADSRAVREQLQGMHCTILSQTTVNGSPMMVVTGPRNEGHFIQELSAKNEHLVKAPEKKPFDAWKVRSYLGFGGQTLQLASSLMKGKPDVPLLVFASTNLTANGINLAYKAQQRDDPYQLLALKKSLNERLAPQLRDGATLLDVNDTRALLRERNKPKATDPIDSFMRKNSVNVGELGLRYVGALGMAFPASDWKNAFQESRMPMLDKRAPLRSIAGFGSILGKTMALTSKVPDPYNPKPQTALDHIREKYSFLAGGLVEAGAFSILTYDAFMNTGPKGTGKLDGAGKEIMNDARSLKFRGKPYPDILSGIGGAMFVTGYIVRSWAKFGERHVNMPELYAHASDTLAMVPQEKLPQALAETSAYLSEHFKHMPGISFNIVYNKLEDDLCRSHHITIGSTTPVQQTAATAEERAIDPAQAPANKVETASITRINPSIAEIPAQARSA